MLVNYSDSSSDSDDNLATIKPGCQQRKAGHVPPESTVKKAPPLPSSFHSLYATAVRTSTSDDPSLHAGRTRQIPHVAGNWPTHVYLEWYPSPEGLVILNDVIGQSELAVNSSSSNSDSSIRSFLRSDLGALLPLHISLSAPLVLKTEHKDAFQESLETRVARAQVKAFAIDIIGLDWVGNHDQTRFFLVLRLSRPQNDELNRLLAICNSSAQQFGLPQLYEESRDSAVQNDHSMGQAIADRSEAFHISIAWTLQKPNRETELLSQDQWGGLKVKFEQLKVKIGNAVADLPLAKHEDIQNS